MTQPTPEAFPQLSPDQLDRLRAYGRPADVPEGEVLFAVGDADYDLVLIDSGAVHVVREATADAPEAVIAEHGAGRFLGELNMITGQATYLSARMAEAGHVHRISPTDFRRLMDTDPDLSDIILRAFLARRRVLQAGEAARSLEILGTDTSAPALALRTYAARQQLPHVWVDVDSPAGAALARAEGVQPADLPAVVAYGAVLRRATPGELAEHLGLSYRRDDDHVHDLVVVGAGPAGLAAAVYGASEGLDTLLLDSVAAGGQAAASSRIENYLGFTSGISGADLTGRAAVQAQKFGARIASPCRVARLDTDGGVLQVVLADGTGIGARTVLVATGARYRALPLDRWSDFEGAGIFYAATEIEARACGTNPVAVVGGANSAGQAALYLADRTGGVTLVVRGPDLRAGMSAYLADRIVAHPAITVRTSSAVTALHGGAYLDAVTLSTSGEPGGAGEEIRQACRGLFCFIGAVPATDWLEGTGIATDGHGFVLTDAQLPRPGTGPGVDRPALPFETSLPGVFAAGDVRAGSMKRVAAAVGEGASAVRSVHAALGSVGV